MKQTIKNQKLFFISLIGIVVVSLVMGTTYAYQTLQVDYEEGSSSNIGGDGLQTPKLEVNFNVTCKEGKTCDEENDNYNRINLTNMPLLPDYKAADYTEFTLNNNSTSDVAYKINLIDITYSPNLATSDFKYTITEIVEGVETVKFEGDFSTLSTTMFLLNPEKPYTYLEKNKSKTIRIYLWLQETSSDQNALENTSFQGKVEITSLFKNELLPIGEKVLLSAKNALQTNDSTRTLYNDTFDITNITGVSAETDRMLLPVEDDYGTSYIFRGNVKDNYVKFAGFTWRIVRINGDGTVRLILDGTLDKVKREGSSSYVGTTSAFNTKFDDNAYVGYMYGLNGTITDANRCLVLENDTVVDKASNASYNTKEKCENLGGNWTTTAYEATHANIKSSTIKNAVDKFYETYLESNTNNYHYQKFLADSLFCADKRLSNRFADNVTITEYLGYGYTENYYGIHIRIKPTLASPSLKCAETATNNYSRYTSSINMDTQINNKIIVNNTLKYPIALLNGDELVLAGAFNAMVNTGYYLYNSSTLAESWFTMTPYGVPATEAYPYMYIVSSYSSSSNSEGKTFSSLSAHQQRGVRPVINLRADLLSTGDGTIESPYEVMLAPDLAGTVPEEEMVTFKFVGKDNISETSEYTVKKGMTFKEFMQKYESEFGVGEDDVIEFSNLEIDDPVIMGIIYTRCKSPTGVIAKLNSIIENGVYSCGVSETIA